MGRGRRDQPRNAKPQGARLSLCHRFGSALEPQNPFNLCVMHQAEIGARRWQLEGGGTVVPVKDQHSCAMRRDSGYPSARHQELLQRRENHHHAAVLQGPASLPRGSLYGKSLQGQHLPNFSGPTEVMLSQDNMAWRHDVTAKSLHGSRLWAEQVS
ncbi:hypothetical protein IHE44_0006721 [Lamprotornis superbus]|uniref:Uncharacterized protein n=1 Tax=Lamprotornis superbus TaxID=245042 RepID=A0A835NIB9_9PASS|nr:hypothetical protein IHE44_0006721 [Lamprotornis superbus]